jgi:adenylate cyclase
MPYVPDHPHRAVHAARNLLQATGHTDPGGPWLPVGAGVHTGIAYVGVVGSEETVYDLTALGDTVNTTARLASLAGPGEILVSDDTGTALRRIPGDAAGLAADPAEHRDLHLKGRTEPIGVRVLKVQPGPVPAR